MDTLQELQRSIELTRAERGFTTDPVRLLCLLVEEVGEVAAEVKKTWSDNYPAPRQGDLADELADVFVVLSALASAFEVDLHDAVQSKFFDSDARRVWATSQRSDPPPAAGSTSR
ncbi:MAG: MazG nucleotide pyrophosphohydrolase domain-containing protein [Actinomycetota bacterium]